NVRRRKGEAVLVVLGSLLGTAIITSSFVVGDTLNASIRDEARTRLGPIDETILVAQPDGLPAVLARLTATPIPDIDGLLPALTAPVSAATVDAPGRQRLAEPNAAMSEVDSNAARGFGRDPAATGFAAAGPTPSGTEAVINQDLADDLHLGVGDQVEAYLYGTRVAFSVRGVVPRLGVAGFRTQGDDQHARNLFVAPGTLVRLAAAATAGTARPPSALVFVSNVGGVFDGARATPPVFRELRARTAGLNAELFQSKQDVLERAKEVGDRFATLFGLVGAFTVIAGVLLLVNIVVMLAEERKAELGMLRALGFKRNHLVRAFGLEGNLYAIVAASLGAVAGVGVGRVVVKATETIFASGNRDLSLRFAVRPVSLVIGFLIGLAICMLTVWGASVRIGRLNVIRAIRDLPEPESSHRRDRLALGVAGVLLGVVAAAVGIAGRSPIPALIGPPIALWSLVPLVGRLVAHRLAVSVPCLLALTWGVAAFSVLPSVFDGSDVSVFLAQGVVLVFTSVWLVVTNDDGFHLIAERLSASGRGLAARLALANPLAKRFRTALLLGMYSLVVFVLVFLASFADVFQAQAPRVAREASAGYDVVLDVNPSSPLTADDVVHQAGVAAVAPLVQARPQYQLQGSTGLAQQQTLTGFDESLLERGTPVLAHRDRRFASDSDAWRAVLRDPALAIVPGGLLSRGGGPSRTTVAVGARITVIDPASGRRHDVTVVATTDEADYVRSGMFVAATTVPTLISRSAQSRFYVAAAPGTDPTQLARRLQGDLLVNGAKADTFRTLVDQSLSRQNDFLRLLQGYLALGLVIGIAGLGVVMVRAVRERRREIGMLRAIGFSSRVVRTAFLLEAAFIAGQGVAIGMALGLITSFSVITHSSILGGESLPFTVPWTALAALAAASLSASLLAVYAPAAQASRIKPAVALRIAD
ncbi:MAG: putative transport system permease protein, partial [Acidimicrobiaceae bacterium]